MKWGKGGESNSNPEEQTPQLSAEDSRPREDRTEEIGTFLPTSPVPPQAVPSSSQNNSADIPFLSEILSTLNHLKASVTHLEADIQDIKN